MAISRCNKCGSLAEHVVEMVGTTQLCAQCATDVAVYDTTFFVGRLLEQFFALRQELTQLKAVGAPQAPASGAISTLPLDLHDTDHFSSEAQHRAILDWLHGRSITATINAGAVDTSGFFDEAAVAIGTDRELLGHVCDRIRYAQQKELNSALVYLDKRSDGEAKAIEAFARKLHHWSLVARYFVNEQEKKNIRLILQSAPSVRRFFAGEWLEWFALMTVLRICKERGVEFSCARNLILNLPGDEKRELDVFFLLKNSQPLYVECKTGEFRQDLAKYVALRKRLNLDSRHFIICVADMDRDHAKGLRAMHDLTFVNTETLAEHVASLV
jgi:hypothetical protein